MYKYKYIYCTVLLVLVYFIGKQLALVAQTETSVAEVQREGIEAASAALLRPFKTFLETDAIALKVKRYLF